LLVGEARGNKPTIPGWDARWIGYKANEDAMARALAAADLTVVPSLAENLSNIALESLACGTPVLAFDVGGMKDVVRHMETGYLARRFDTEDLAAGLRALLENEPLRARLGARCREIALAEYARDRELQQFVRLYEGVTQANDPLSR
jgi:glycosyltransferase involved in cell wall biosynthesis